MTESNEGCMPKVVNWRRILRVFNVGHQIYPLEPIASKDCEFIVIDSKVRIRVIHISPENLRRSLINANNIDFNIHSKRNSLSEEYWFTKWNKPLKIGTCNCSFRRSLRLSVISNQPTSQNNDKRLSKCSLDSTPTKIINVETFVERLIQETFFEAFQEYYMQSLKKSGNVNLAYEPSEEDDVVVTLRKKFKHPNRHLPEDAKHSERICSHKRAKKRPVVLLLHGIGSTADVWWIVMNSLIIKGYEVVAPDLLGHGYSSAPDKASLYTFDNLLLQIVSIFDHYVGTDEKRKCIIIAHSFGCSLATALYQHRAQQIVQIILISGGGPTPLAPPVHEDQISPYGCIHNLLHPLLICGVKRSFFYSSRGKYFRACSTECAVPAHILKYYEKGQSWPQGDAAYHRKIMIPTLLVHGLQDKNVTLVQECEMERTIPRAFLELIPNAGHMAMIETPEHLTHMILCFLDLWS